MDNMFGKRLKALRKSKNWSQAYLGTKLTMDGKSVPGKTLGNWERGDRKVPMDIVNQLSVIFKVSNDYLLGKDVPSWATSEDVIKIDNLLNENSKLTLEYEGQLISSEDRDNLRDMIAFYFWQKEAKARGINILREARDQNKDRTSND